MKILVTKSQNSVTQPNMSTSRVGDAAPNVSADFFSTLLAMDNPTISDDVSNDSASISDSTSLDDSSDAADADKMLQDLQVMVAQGNTAVEQQDNDQSSDLTVVAEANTTNKNILSDLMTSSSLASQNQDVETKADAPPMATEQQPATQTMNAGLNQQDNSNDDLSKKQLDKLIQKSQRLNFSDNLKIEQADNTEEVDARLPSDNVVNLSSLDNVSSMNALSTGQLSESKHPENNIMDSMDKFTQLVSSKMHGQTSATPAGDLNNLNAGTQDFRAVTMSSSPTTLSQSLATAATEMSFHVDEQHMSSSALGIATYQANIKIYPPELGQISASLKVSNNRAILEITADNAQTKEILDSHMDDLRHQFNQSNLVLDSIQVTVQQQTTSNQDNQNNHNVNEDQTFDPSPTLSHGLNQSIETTRKRENALVDAYI